MSKISTIRERVHMPFFDTLIKDLHDPVRQMVELGYDRDVLRAVIEDEQHPERGAYAVLAALAGVDLFGGLDDALDRAELAAGLFPGLEKKP